jgi:spore coat protein U-like protein
MLLNRHVQMLGLVAVAAFASAPGEVAAATLEVTATVPNSCTVEGGSLAFGTYNSGQVADLLSSGGFNVQCTAPASVNVALDGGLNHGVGANGRAMKGPGTSNFLDYTLFLGPGFSTSWDDGVALPFNVINGGNPIEVTGRIDGGQTAVGGEYSDTVQITLTFN